MRNLPFALIMEKNSFLVFMFSLNMPSTADVVNSATGLGPPGKYTGVYGFYYNSYSFWG